MSYHCFLVTKIFYTCMLVKYTQKIKEIKQQFYYSKQNQHLYFDHHSHSHFYVTKVLSPCYGCLNILWIPLWFVQKFIWYFCIASTGKITIPLNLHEILFFRPHLVIWHDTIHILTHHSLLSIYINFNFYSALLLIDWIDEDCISIIWF